MVHIFVAVNTCAGGVKPVEGPARDFTARESAEPPSQCGRKRTRDKKEEHGSHVMQESLSPFFAVNNLWLRPFFKVDIMRRG